MDKIQERTVAQRNDTNNENLGQISMKQFLDFLRTAYQVTETVEDTLASVEGTTEIVDWIKLKNTTFVKSKSTSSLTSTEAMRNKLDEVLNEGLLDSVLPYLVPANFTKKSSTKLLEKTSSSGISRTTTSKDSLGRRKSTDISAAKPTVTKTDSEVEIHVCDELKNVKKDFVCSQKLLVEKMGYFAEVTAGQKLEDIDISVHCDISIFEWLMLWVKKDLIPEEDWPKLDSQSVIPILVSSAFLHMEPLLQDCLFYCHENMNEILQSSTNLNCLNDSIITRLNCKVALRSMSSYSRDNVRSRNSIKYLHDSLVTRLAAMYTNTELETIKDKRDKIQSRLYCKMIISLCEPVCESVRGHWNSLAWIYQCVHCEQLIMPEIAAILPCRPFCMSINRTGDIISHHARNTTWNLNNYIVSLYNQVKSWRKVYWRLWGDCHYLVCTVCNKPFPAHKLKWCCYHPEPPQYFTVDSQKTPLPIGRYSCCGERAYRFQLLENYSGCQFKDHVPNTSKPREAAIFAILQKFRDVIDTEPPELIFPEKLTRLVARDSAAMDGKLTCKEVFWWEGLQIVPPRQNLGLLGAFGNITSGKEMLIYEDTVDLSSEEESSSDSSYSATEHSEESRHISPKTVPKRKVVKKKSLGRLWQMNLSARSNQDIQRANEEVILSRMINFMSKMNSVDSGPKQKGLSRYTTPPGGVYARLEAEWREANCSAPVTKRVYNSHKSKIRGAKLS